MPDGPGGFTQDYSCPALLRIPRGRRGLRVRNCHPLRLNFPGHSPRRRRAARRGPTTPRVRRHTRGLGSSPFARHYWGNHCYFLLLRVLRCFSSPGSPPYTVRMTVLQTAGLSHSEIRASKVTCTYTRLIAACHVLHRLREPRHPPDALNSLLRLMSALHPSRGSGTAHTFSCNFLRFLHSLIYYITYKRSCFSVKKQSLLLLLTVLCANMSKNSSARVKPLFVAEAPDRWRITDSNR